MEEKGNCGSVTHVRSRNGADSFVFPSVSPETEPKVQQDSLKPRLCREIFNLPELLQARTRYLLPNSPASFCSERAKEQKKREEDEKVLITCS